MCSLELSNVSMSAEFQRPRDDNFSFFLQHCTRNKHGRDDFELGAVADKGNQGDERPVLLLNLIFDGLKKEEKKKRRRKINHESIQRRT
jgi:hypothetical protein